MPSSRSNGSLEIISYLKGSTDGKGGLSIVEKSYSESDQVTTGPNFQLTWAANGTQLHGVRGTSSVVLVKTVGIAPQNSFAKLSCGGTQDDIAGAAVHFLMGSAAPLPDFATMIPFNPIEWVAVSLPPTLQTDSGRSIVGVGFMAGSDVPDRPIVLFSIVGNIDREGRVSATKTYEFYKETKGFDVEYKGTVAGEANGAARVVGTWTNEKGMSKGLFSLWELEGLPRAEDQHPCIVFCGACNRWMPIGTLHLQFLPKHVLQPAGGQSDPFYICYDCSFPPNVEFIAIEPCPTGTDVYTLDGRAMRLEERSWVERICSTPTADFHYKVDGLLAHI